MSDNIIDFNDKFIESLVERDDFLKRGEELLEEIKKFLPQDRVSEVAIENACQAYIHRISANESLLTWEDDVLAILGIPDFVYDSTDMDDYPFTMVPLSIITDVASKTSYPVRFSLFLDERKWFGSEEEDNDDDENEQVIFRIIHFDWPSFQRSNNEFENEYLPHIKHVFDEPGKPMSQELIINSHEHSHLRKKMQLGRFVRTVIEDDIYWDTIQAILDTVWGIKSGEWALIFDKIQKQPNNENVLENFELLGVDEFYEIATQFEQVKEQFETLESFYIGLLTFKDFHLETEEILSSSKYYIELIDKYIENTDETILNELNSKID